MESYFFIPAAKESFVKNINRLSPDYFVFDFEDSIDTSKLDDAITVINTITIQSNFFARFYWNAENVDNSFVYLKKLIELGFTNFFVPKFRTREDLSGIYNLLKLYGHFQQFKIVLLIENPQALCALENILSVYQPAAVALGSHDYCAEMGMLHTADNIQWARNYLLNFAKAAFISCIDVASMNISDKSALESEFRDTFNKGFDAKLLIHPVQLDVFKTTKYYSVEELEIALKLKDIIKQIGGIQNFTIANLNGIVIEKPHLNRYLKILKMASHDRV